MSEPNQYPIDSPEVQAYIDASIETHSALVSRLERDERFVSNDGHKEQLPLIDQSTGKKWWLTRQEGRVELSQPSFDDDGKYSTSVIYFFDDQGLRRANVKADPEVDPDVWIESISFPSPEAFKLMPESEQEKWVERALDGYVKNVIENQKLEREFNSYILSPEEQQALLEELSKTVPEPDLHT